MYGRTGTGKTMLSTLCIEAGECRINVDEDTDPELIKKVCRILTDMRKSINGLMMIVQDSFSLDPFKEALFAFCNRKRDRIKILEWDGDGFWLYHVARRQRTIIPI